MATQLRITRDDITLLRQAMTFQLQETAKLPLTPNQEKQQQARTKLLRKLDYIYADMLKLESTERVPDVRQDFCGSDTIVAPISF